MHKAIWILCLTLSLSLVGCISPNRFGPIRTEKKNNTLSEEWSYQKRFWNRIAMDIRDAKADFDRIFLDLEYYPVEE